jgi:hypothetical protein
MSRGLRRSAVKAGRRTLSVGRACRIMDDRGFVFCCIHGRGPQVSGRAYSAPPIRRSRKPRQAFSS